MTSLKAVARRADKGVARPSDIFRVQAGHHLVYESILDDDEGVEKQTFQKVVKKIARRNQGCLVLPLTAAYFVFYALACSFHEDITNVFFLESSVRHEVNNIFADEGSSPRGGPLDSIDNLWDTLEGQFFPFLLSHKNMYGEELPPSDWNRVLMYSQVQSLVRFRQIRKVNEDSFGVPYTSGGCSSSTPENVDDCPAPLRRYVSTDMGFSLTLQRGNYSLDRRLQYANTHLSQELPDLESAGGSSHFTWYLWPSMNTSEQEMVMKYFRDRQWIDANTEAVEIDFYLLNAELGRPRVVTGVLRFMFSDADEIFYQFQSSTIFLELLSGWFNLLVDAAWFLTLVFITAWRVHLLWTAFIHSTFLHHITDLFNLWETVIVTFGWGNCGGFYIMYTLLKKVSDSLELVRGTDPASTALSVHEDFFQNSSDAAKQLANFRLAVAWYLIILVFKFFVSFSAQPRLAVVTTTLRYTFTDLVHFFIIFVPCLVAYVVSGNLLFGRRVEEFSTLQASLGATLRIIFESEYDWEVLASDFYWTTALWVWSLVLLIVLLMLNMVLAIILDVHHSVHTSAATGETLFATIINFASHLRQLKVWVPNSQILAWMEEQAAEGGQQGVITEDQLKDHFPDIPQAQIDIFMRASKSDMKFEAGHLVSLEKSLRIAGSLKLSYDHSAPYLDGLTKRCENPLDLYAAPKLRDAALTEASDPHVRGSVTAASAPAYAATNGNGKRNTRVRRTERPEELQQTFMEKPGHFTSGKQPRLLTPEEFDATRVAWPATSSPEWLKDITSMLDVQRKTLRWLSHHVQEMQWHVSHAQMAALQETRPDGPTEGTKLRGSMRIHGGQTDIIGASAALSKRVIGSDDAGVQQVIW
mmetsp:Transcript_62699/g.149590  ORF Transcript_62699/g.149590 Transcript_62699/m.149590 type:complete len:867 (-) Transcript_62699:49-2649(-)